MTYEKYGVKLSVEKGHIKVLCDHEPTLIGEKKSLFGGKKIVEQVYVLDEPDMFLGLHDKEVFGKDGSLVEKGGMNSFACKMGRDDFLKLANEASHINKYNMLTGDNFSYGSKVEEEIMKSKLFEKLLAENDIFMVLGYNQHGKKGTNSSSPYDKKIYDGYLNDSKKYFELTERIVSRYPNVQRHLM